MKIITEESLEKTENKTIVKHNIEKIFEFDVELGENTIHVQMQKI